MSETKIETTAFAEALDDPLDTIASVLLFVGVGALAGGVSIKLFTQHLANEVCTSAACSTPIYATANSIIPIVAAIGGVALAAGMLLPEVARGDEK